jgi:hypothetical protein
MGITAIGGNTAVANPAGSTNGTSNSAVGSGSLDSLLGSVLQTGASSYGAQNSAEDITQGINAGITTQQNTMGNINSLYATQLATGNSADTQLQKALGLNGQTVDPSTFENTPGYQFAVQQGTTAAESAAAANGNAYTPNTLTNVGQTVAGLASQNYNNYVSNLLQTAGLGSQANSTVANANLQTGENTSQLQQNSGVAQGAGVSGVSNNVSSLLSGLNSSGVLSSAASGIGSLLSSGASAIGNLFSGSGSNSNSGSTGLNLGNGFNTNLYGGTNNSNFQSGYSVDPTTGAVTQNNLDSSINNPLAGVTYDNAVGNLSNPFSQGSYNNIYTGNGVNDPTVNFDTGGVTGVVDSSSNF